MHITLQGCVNVLEQAESRAELDAQIQELLPNWSLAPIVTALQALRGVALVIAVTLVAEVGDFNRFSSADPDDCLTKENMKGHWDCPCGSGKRLRNCHWNDLKAIHEKVQPLVVRSGLGEAGDIFGPIGRHFRQLDGE